MSRVVETLCGQVTAVKRSKLPNRYDVTVGNANDPEAQRWALTSLGTEWNPRVGEWVDINVFVDEVDR